MASSRSSRSSLTTLPGRWRTRPSTPPITACLSTPTRSTQTLAQLGTWVPGPQRAVLLIGPPFTGQASWQPLLAAAEAAQPGATSPDAHFDLRTPPDPSLADLTTVTVAVPWYTADLADPGSDLAAVVAQVGAVVGRVQELRSGAPVVLVAHSTAGLAARAFAAANPAQVAGLITIGTPHGPADLTVLDDPTQTDAVASPPACSMPPRPPRQCGTWPASSLRSARDGRRPPRCPRR